MLFLAFPKLPGQVAFPGFYTDQLQPAKTITWCLTHPAPTPILDCSFFSNLPSLCHNRQIELAVHYYHCNKWNLKQHAAFQCDYVLDLLYIPAT
jgi:hypothetical protein